MRLLIKGGRLLDPGQVDDMADILIEDGRIADIRFQASGDKVQATGQTSASSEDVDRTIDAAGLIVTPGLIDMHVHLREPGEEYKETIASGCQAAVRGGFVAVCPMANTCPVNDRVETTCFIRQKAVEAGSCRVWPVAAVTSNLDGFHLTEFGELKAAGVVALSDDGRPIRDARLMRKAMEYARGFNLPIVSHCEEKSLTEGGAMNEGALATQLGLAGMPNVSESLMVMRDIALAELTGVRLHIAHVSTAEAVDAIRLAKQRGVAVTAETAPHYFTLTEDAVGSYNTNAKMYPPLRSAKDREAIREGLRDGTLDAIASDHAPHSGLEKEVEFDQAANGIVGLETSLALGLKLVHEELLSLERLIDAMSIQPGRILGMDRHLEIGQTADLTLIDPAATFRVDAADFASISRNTPFDGWTLTGKAVLTIVGGQVVFEQRG
jgi:dihydroorotase